ncbi:PDZ domain-containing protein [Agreia bicolorata]|uniref:endopeptidase La n=1 Tax=Agreia bicolorata TaxID=110935 RepID=A0A1T4YDC0_9MICO|nr:PDZ domain-containing protein [Agreia bicolorata]SKA99265.1 PDZ domain-containing protein [Agreia bicolorata]
MSLFGLNDADRVDGTNGQSGVPFVLRSPEEIATERRTARRRTTGWTVLVVALVLGLVMSFLPTPYVIEQPGPVFDTLGSQTVDGKDTPLISIDGETTYPTGGTLDMLTVSVVGTPKQTPSWAEVVQAYFDSSKAVVPLEAVYPPDVTTEERDEQNAALMVDSQQEAIAAALSSLGYDFTTRVGVGSVAKGSPAEGQLEPGDVVTSVNGQPVGSIDELRSAVAANGIDKPAVVDVTRDGAPIEASITPITSGDTSVLGIGVQASFEFPFDVKIQLDNVGGPSAGMMFALGIIDKLSDGELNGGQKVAGTGTISADGTVGPIGGIRQKLFGARDAGADFFLAPASNCDEVVGHVPDGIRVFAVATLDDSLAALKAISSGTGLDALPTCDASPAT